jgi:hypothetical protein
LLQAELSDLSKFALDLVQELATEITDINIRQLAGLCLKNLIATKGDESKNEKLTRWKSIDHNA